VNKYSFKVYYNNKFQEVINLETTTEWYACQKAIEKAQQKLKLKRNKNG
jgi:DNA-dependent RNA polymerase auxiliary subunit epsilon